MEEAYTDGMENNIIYIKDNLNQGEEMGEALFGGKMDPNIAANFQMGNKLVLEYYIELAIIFNMKEVGLMECSMEKGYNILKMDRGMKDSLNKTSFTVEEL